MVNVRFKISTLSRYLKSIPAGKPSLQPIRSSFTAPPTAAPSTKSKDSAKKQKQMPDSAVVGAAAAIDFFNSDGWSDRVGPVHQNMLRTQITNNNIFNILFGSHS